MPCAKYCRSKVKMSQVNGHTTAKDSSIPIVDFAEWTIGNQDQRKTIADKFLAACQTVGFVYIINHGVPSSKVEEAFAVSKKLFDLSEDEKKLAPHPPGGAHHRGYSWPGFEKVTQAFGDEENKEKLTKELRSISDVKVCYVQLSTRIS